VQGRGVSHSRSVAGQSTKCRASRCSFLLGGFRVRVGQPHELPRIAVLLPAGWVPGSGGSAPRTAAHRGTPSCRYLLRDTSAGCIRQISGWHAWSGKVSEMSPRA
jgi:hypothetical protein